jgi:hypothetical protein
MMYRDEITKPQFAYIEQLPGGDTPSIHCPFCGKISMNNGEVEGCVHLTFIYIEEKEKFVFGTKKFMKLAEKLGEIRDFEFDDEDEDEYFEKIFDQGGYGSELLVLYITHGGKDTDQVQYEDKYGFDISKKL